MSFQVNFVSEDEVKIYRDEGESDEKELLFMEKIDLVREVEDLFNDKTIESLDIWKSNALLLTRRHEQTSSNDKNASFQSSLGDIWRMLQRHNENRHKEDAASAKTNTESCRQDEAVHQQSGETGRTNAAYSDDFLSPHQIYSHSTHSRTIYSPCHLLSPTEGPKNYKTLDNATENDNVSSNTDRDFLAARNGGLRLPFYYDPNSPLECGLPRYNSSNHSSPGLRTATAVDPHSLPVHDIVFDSPDSSGMIRGANKCKLPPEPRIHSCSTLSATTATTTAPGAEENSGDSNNKKCHIKKPLNAFMLFMKEMRARVVAECTLKESAAINQILGRRWHSLSREEQAKYYEMARQEKERHQKLYPNWSARDNYASHTKKEAAPDRRASQQQQQRSFAPDLIPTQFLQASSFLTSPLLTSSRQQIHSFSQLQRQHQQPSQPPHQQQQASHPHSGFYPDQRYINQTYYTSADTATISPTSSTSSSLLSRPHHTMNYLYKPPSHYQPAQVPDTQTPLPVIPPSIFPFPSTSTPSSYSTRSHYHPPSQDQYNHHMSPPSFTDYPPHSLSLASYHHLSNVISNHANDFNTINFLRDTNFTKTLQDHTASSDLQLGPISSEIPPTSQINLSM